MSSIEQKKEALIHKTFLLMFRILLIFGIPAIAGFFLGRWIDQSYDVRPYGTLGILLITFTLSWVLIIRMYLRISAEFKALREQEEQEHHRRQKEVQQNLKE